MSGIFEALRARQFTGDIDINEGARRAVARDASIFEVMPRGVIAPRTTEDIKAVVRWASDMTKSGANVFFAPRVGGTCMSGGPLTEGYVLDLSRYFNRMGQINFSDRTLSVQTGVMHKYVENYTRSNDLLFAPYTSSHDICGIGGMIGNNASGEMSIKYGPTSSNISSLKVVLSDGNEYEFKSLTRSELNEKCQQPDFEGDIYRRMIKLLDDNEQVIATNHPRTVKNAAGYQLWDLWDSHKQTFNLGRLFVGAQGTLGVVTEAKLKLVQLAKNTRMIVAPIDNLDNLPKVVRTMLRFDPASCETFDHFTYDLAEKYHQKEAELAIAAKGKHIVILGVYEGRSQKEADILAGKAKEALEALNQQVEWIEGDDVAEAFLNIRRWSFKMLLEHPIKNTRAEAFLEDTIVPLDSYGEFLNRLEDILKDYNMTYTYAGHIGSGSIRLVPLVDMEAEKSAEKVMELETKVNQLVWEFNGSISVDHNDGIIRTPYLEGQFGPELYGVMKEVKNIFDPQNIFNPGKKVGGTYKYALDHVIRENVT